MKDNQQNQTPHTWKAWVDWWPTYFVIGISLAYFIDETGIVQKLTSKLFTKKEEE